MEIAKSIAPICLAIIMFGLGLGLTAQDFLRVIKNPKDFFIGFLSQVILLPIVAIILISLISPIKTFAGFPEGEKGYDLKKIEESFKLPCNEIGNDECIARAFGVGACTWVFGIKNGKDSKEALRISDSVLIALMKGNNLDINSIFEKDGTIKKTIELSLIHI